MAGATTNGGGTNWALDGQVAIVTGGDRGIGGAIARALAGAGAHVVVAARDQAGGTAAADAIGGTFVRLDVTDSSAVTRTIADIADRLGRLDILVNNAGICRNAPAEAMTDEDWHAVFDVNCDGVFWCSREAGKVMLKQGSGSIINIASMSGIITNHPQLQVAYNASKAAVIMITKSMAAEWATRGVRVNAIAPGYVVTAMSIGGMNDPVMREEWLRSTPMGRAAQPEEIAPAAVYLASAASSYVTGSVLVVDGGYTAW